MQRRESRARILGGGILRACDSVLRNVLKYQVFLCRHSVYLPSEDSLMLVLVFVWSMKLGILTNSSRKCLPESTSLIVREC